MYTFILYGRGHFLRIVHNEPRVCSCSDLSPPTHANASCKTMAQAEAALLAASQTAETSTEDMEAQLEAAMARIAELEADSKKAALRHKLELAKSTIARMEAEKALAEAKVPEPQKKEDDEFEQQPPRPRPGLHGQELPSELAKRAEAAKGTGQSSRWQQHLENLGTGKSIHDPLNSALMMPPPNAPPNDPTDKEAALHASLEPDLKGILRQYMVPYHLWSRMAMEYISTMGDLVEKFDSKRQIKQESPADWDYEMGSNGFDKDSSNIAKNKLAQAWAEAERRLAKRIRLLEGSDGQARNSGPVGCDGSGVAAVAFSRDGLEEAYKPHNKGEAPVPREEGSDVLLNVMFKSIQTRGILPEVEAQKIAPLLKNRHLHTKRPETMVQGQRLYDEFTQIPETPEQLKALWAIWRTSVKMMVGVGWHHVLLKCPFETIDALYDWLEGDEMLLSDPPPDLLRLLNAEKANVVKSCREPVYEDPYGDNFGGHSKRFDVLVEEGV